MNARAEIRTQIFRAVWVVLLLILFSFERANAEPGQGDCTFQHDEGVLRVMGDDNANTVDIAGTGEGVRVTCDGDTNMFTDLVKIIVMAGAGDDQTFVDKSSCEFDQTALEIYAQEDDDEVIVTVCPNAPSDPLYEPTTVIGGPGVDVLKVLNRAPQIPLPDPDNIIWTIAPVDVDDTVPGDGPCVILPGFSVSIGAEILCSSGYERVSIEDGPGDGQINIDNHKCLMNQIAIEVFFQDGDDSATVIPCPNAPSDPLYKPTTILGGSGADIVKLIHQASQIPPEPLVQRLASPAPGSSSGQACRVATDGVVTVSTSVETLCSSGIEELRLEDGPGDLQMTIDNTTGKLLRSMAISVAGQEGDDDVILLQPAESIDAVSVVLVSLGPGTDKFSVVGHSDHEDYELTGVPDLTVPDPHILVTNRVTGAVTGNMFVQGTETVRLLTGPGDDHVEVTWDADSWSGLTLLQLILGSGDDSLNFNTQRAANELDDVQPFMLDVEGGDGDDSVEVTYRAGSWLDLGVTADLGTGDDAFVGAVDDLPSYAATGLEAPPSANIEVIAGEGDDSVIIHNRRLDDLVTLNITALLGAGGDLLEALGDMSLLAEPGRGEDTARVTHNLLRFVTAFEEVDIIE